MFYDLKWFSLLCYHIYVLRHLDSSRSALSYAAWKGLRGWDRAARTLEYLVAKGGDPAAKKLDGTSVIDQVPIKSDDSGTPPSQDTNSECAGRGHAQYCTVGGSFDIWEFWHLITSWWKFWLRTLVYMYACVLRQNLHQIGKPPNDFRHYCTVWGNDLPCKRM